MFIECCGTYLFSFCLVFWKTQRIYRSGCKVTSGLLLEGLLTFLVISNCPKKFKLCENGKKDFIQFELNCGPDFFQPERSEQHCCTPSGTHCHIDVWTNGVCRSRSLQCYNSYQDSHWYQPTLHHQPFHGTHEIMDGWTLTIIVFAQTNQTRYSILVSHAENKNKMK